MLGNQNSFKKYFIFLHPSGVAERKHCPRKLSPEVSRHPATSDTQLHVRWDRQASMEESLKPQGC